MAYRDLALPNFTEYRQTTWGVSSVVLLVLFLAGLALLAFSRPTEHTDIYLLAAECGLLLPAIVLAVRATPCEKGRAWLPVPPIWLTLIVFFALNLIVRSFITQDVAAGDEAAYHFQARLFAEGLVAAEAPPDVHLGDRLLRAIFRFHHHAMVGDRWLTQYPPGWPAVLSVAWRMRLDWLVNPFLGAWILLLTWRIGSRLYDSRTGALGAMLAALSPSFEHQTSGYLSNPFCGALLITAAYFYLRVRQSGFWRDSVCSLLCIGGAILVRPYTGVCAGAVVGLLLLAEAKKRGGSLRFAVLAGAVGAIFLGIYLGYNLYAHDRLSSYSSAGWSAKEIFVLNPFELLESVARNTRWSIQSTMMYAFPFLLPLAAYTLLSDREGRVSAWTLGALALSLMTGYSATKLVSGVYFGERYYYEIYFAACLLAARGVLLLLEDRPRAVMRVAGPALVICGAVYICHVVLYVQRASEILAPYAAIRDASRQINERHSVVYLPINFGRDINLNAPDWKAASSVYLEDPGESLRASVSSVLGRQAWYVLSYDPGTRTASMERHALQ